LTKSSRETYWPKRWARKHGAIYYRPKASEQHEWDHKSWFRLGSNEAEAFACWYARRNAAPSAPATLADCIDIFIREVLPLKAEKTQEEYQKQIPRLRRVFGHMAPGALEPRHVYAYLSKRPSVAGNREKSLLSSIISNVAIRYGAVNRNVVREVRRATEKARDRYVTDEEVENFLPFCSPKLRLRIQMLQLTGMRPGQLRTAWVSNWDGTGLKIKPTKGGRKVRYIGPELKSVVKEAIALRTGKASSSKYLFPNRSGNAYTPDGWRTVWQKAMKAYGDAGNERFQERDLRAKVASDSQSLMDAHARLGHQNTATTKRVYVRGVQDVPTLSPASLIDESAKE